ncbi:MULTISPECIES: LysR family transcriptional regulator [Caballeronia]|uniref:LysR family transcriptional regulator n=1 Tax=Caballeronia jiangsuensis TaxID=1458357 RepID=A0ABW9CXQ5_9BURK|nr:LysR family transcriptional regulator [Caballeronia sp. GaOx3]
MVPKSTLPLTAIRVFVTVGRHGNFTRAAEALGITQSAVSRHIATLEALVRCSLFERRGPQLTLTPSGAQFHDAVKDAVSTIELATLQLMQGQQEHDRITVRTSMPSFAMTVVIPALGAFTISHPVQIDLVTSLSPPQPREQFDVLITRDLSLPDTESWELIQEELVCVCSPSMHSAHRSKALYRWPLIASRSRPDTIAVWALAKSIPVESLQVHAVYDHLFLAVAAAIGGNGLLIVPRIVVQDHLQTGTLILADQEIVASGAMYVAYVNPRSRHVQMARVFCRWLKGMLRERSQSA